MKTFATLLAKETRALFVSPIAYAVIAVFLLLMGYTFTATLFLSKIATLIHEFFQASMLLLLIVPVITMRLLAEERRGGTLELLLTSPVHEIEVVLAKFLASMAVIVAMLAPTLAYPVTLQMFGDPDWGPVYSGYLGLLLLGGALTSLGLAVSALTANQIVAADRLARAVPPAVDARQPRLAAARSLRQAGDQPVAPGAFHAVCDRRHVPVRFRLLHDLDPARAAAHRAGAGATLSVDASSSRSSTLIWFLGWLVAVAGLFALALRLPLQTRLPALAARLYAGAVVVLIFAVAVLANFALSLHDAHLDLTREAGLHAVAAGPGGGRPPRAARAAHLFLSGPGSERPARRRHHGGHGAAQPAVAGPDRRPGQAADARRDLRHQDLQRRRARGRRPPHQVHEIDESEIAIGIQRVLRERVVTVCFIEGHDEYPVDNFEFHTHFEGAVGHSHGEPASAVIQTTGHGFGRLRRALEGLGYDVRKIMPATMARSRADCAVTVDAGPRTTYLPGGKLGARALSRRRAGRCCSCTTWASSSSPSSAAAANARAAAADRPS